MKQRGFTLIEVMVAVAIIGILAAIVIPNFSAYMNKSRRSDGIVALHKLQQAQEKRRANCRFYAQTLVNDNYDGINDSFCGATANATILETDTTSPETYYTLAITAGTATANSYTATADGSGSVQAGDKINAGEVDEIDCSVLTLTVSGANPNGVKTPAGCW